MSVSFRSPSLDWTSGLSTQHSFTTKSSRLRDGELLFFRASITHNMFDDAPNSMAPWDAVMMIVFINNRLYLYDCDNKGVSRIRRAPDAIKGWKECGYAPIHSYPNDENWVECLREAIVNSLMQKKTLRNDRETIASLLHQTEELMCEKGHSGYCRQVAASLDSLMQTMYEHTNIVMRL